MNIRYTIRTALILMALAAVVFARFSYWSSDQKRKLDDDYDIVFNGRLDIHEWPGKICYGPFETNSERITRLQINIDPHWIETQYITHYNQLTYLETISYFGDSDKISERVLRAFKTFPKLKTIRIMSCRKFGGEDLHYDGNKYYGVKELAKEGFSVMIE